ncbi:MAG: glycosyltransferase family 2 protein [Chitinispirillaceae bacterium]
MFSRSQRNIKPSIDVVVATYRREKQIRELSASLLRMLSDRDHLIVINQGEAELCFEEHPRLRLCTIPFPNLPKARNKGVLTGNGDIVLFLDDDVVPDEKLLEKHRSAYGDANVGAVAGFVDDSLFCSDQSAPSRFDPFTGELIQNFSLSRSQYTISVMGANMSFSRKALERSGGFDHNFRRNALWEEVDLSFRIRSLGYRIWYCSEAKVVHLRENNGGCRNVSGSRYVFDQFANTAYFLCRHSPYGFSRKLLVFWWYRLEYLSRRPQGVFPRHNPLVVFAGICGWISGILRYCLNPKRHHHSIQRTVSENLLNQEQVSCG